VIVALAVVGYLILVAIIAALAPRLLDEFDQLVTVKHRRQTVTAEPTNPKIDLVQTTCPMCNQRIFDAVLPHTIDGAVMASPEMQTEARRLIAEHERTCSGNH
jgi:hypothetical protein